uniref:Caspase family p20 domain-containing protein n=1 Tax=Musca domestica TaxID=7370 RepID=A0A1I8N0U4_MUSDO
MAAKKESNLFKRMPGKCPKSQTTKPKQSILETLTKTLWQFHGIKELALGEAGLKVAIFLLQNPHEELQHTTESSGFFENLPAVDFLCQSPEQILHQLRNSKFIGYASVFVLLQQNSFLAKVIRAMEINTNMTSNEKTTLSPSQQRNKLLGIKNIFQNLGTYIQCKAANTFQLYNQNINIDVAEAQRDLLMFRESNVDNCILVQWYRHDDMCQYQTHGLMLFSVLIQILQPLEGALQESFSSAGCAVTSSSSTAADLYVYSINPALAIIINNYYFTQPLTVRRGSERDVIQLIRELKIARIPYILIEDCNRDQLLEIVHYISSKDFRPLKNLLVFLMSHGGQDGLLYTHDGQINIPEAVIKPIQNNQFLQHTEIQFVINKCRGETDIEWATYSELKNIAVTDNSYLKRNTTVLYSVPNNFLSLRSETDGCPFIQAYCQHFRYLTPNDDIRQLHKQINSNPIILKFFEELEKCTDLIMTSLEHNHNVIPKSDNFFHMMQLLKSIADDFPICDAVGSEVGASSFICGSIGHWEIPKQGRIETYFTPYLEADNFSICEENDNNGE